MKRRQHRLVALLTIFAAPAILFAQYEITSHTIDGGGGFSAGGSFELAGTIGQPDAGPDDGMSGGNYTLVGGFWAQPSVDCSCLGDMNGDGKRDGADIQQFIVCIVSGGTCSCADLNGMSGIGLDDVPEFVSDLLSESGCP